MSGACKRLRPSLELYAEGELRDGRELRVLRRHLAVCAVCRGLLARHDELTRRLLEEGAAAEVLLPWEEVPDEPASFGVSERAEQIWERIESLPQPVPENPEPAVPLWGALSVAALLLIGFHLSGIVREPEGERPEVEVATEFGLEGPAGPFSETGPFTSDGGRVGDREANGKPGTRGVGPLAGKEGLSYLGDLRWVRDPALSASFRRGSAARRERWMWLFAPSRRNGRADARDRPDANVTLALAVEHRRVPGEKERLLLVPEELLAGNACGRMREAGGKAALQVLEVTPRRLLEFAVLSLRREDEGTVARWREEGGGSQRYRVLSLGSLEPRHATVLEAPRVELVGWRGLGKAGEPDPLDRWPAGARLGSGGEPRS